MTAFFITVHESLLNIETVMIMHFACCVHHNRLHRFMKTLKKSSMISILVTPRWTTSKIFHRVMNKVLESVNNDGNFREISRFILGQSIWRISQWYGDTRSNVPCWWYFCINGLDSVNLLGNWCLCVVDLFNYSLKMNRFMSLTHCGREDLWKWTIFNTILTSPKSWLSQEDLDAGCEHSLVPMDS